MTSLLQADAIIKTSTRQERNQMNEKSNWLRVIVIALIILIGLKLLPFIVGLVAVMIKLAMVLVIVYCLAQYFSKSSRRYNSYK